MAAVTRLGLYGGSRGIYGSFAGKAEQVIIPDTTPDGAPGSKRRRRSRYPRRIMIDGVLHWVRNAEEERALLEAHLAKVEADALELLQEDAPKAEIAKARVRVVKAARRVEKVDDREADWLQRLRDEDEEILMAVMH